MTELSEATAQAALDLTKNKKKKKPVAAPVQTELLIEAPVQAKASKKTSSKKQAKKRVKAAADAAPATSDTIILPSDPNPAPTKSKPEKAKAKLVRDSFTMPHEDYALILKLKDRAILMHHPIKKGELLRAGLRVLNGLDDTALKLALEALPALKTGRPKKLRS